MRKLKVAQIGTSHTTHASQVFRSLVTHPDVFEVVGYANVDGEGAMPSTAFQGFPEFTGEQIFSMDDLDALVIECDEIHQTEYAMKAVEKGLPIHLEKPGSEDSESFQKLVDLAEEKQLVFSRGYMYRFNPAVKHLLALCDSGALGDITGIDAQMSCLHPKEMRKWLDVSIGGMMFYLGCHLIDLVYRIAGEPEEILALNRSAHLNGIDAPDESMAIFRYPHFDAVIRTSAVEPGGYVRRKFTVCGTKGAVEICPLERSEGNTDVSTDMVEWKTDADELLDWNNTGKQTRYSKFNRYDEMMLNFAKMVASGEKNPYGYDYERKLHTLIRKACGHAEG